MINPVYNTLICTDKFCYRDTLAKAIETFSENFKIITTVSAYQEVPQFIEFYKIDFLLIRFNRSVKNVFDFVKKIRNRFPKIRLIILTFWEYDFYHNELKKAGAHSVYLIDQKIEVLIEKMNNNIELAEILRNESS